MKRNFVIALTIQSLVILIILVYSSVQRGIAREQERIAVDKAIEAAKNAELAKKEAEQHILVSKRVAELESELYKCQRK